MSALFCVVPAGSGVATVFMITSHTISSSSVIKYQGKLCKRVGKVSKGHRTKRKSEIGTDPVTFLIYMRE
jgi:hypothetical protein